MLTKIIPGLMVFAILGMACSSQQPTAPIVYSGDESAALNGVIEDVYGQDRECLDRFDITSIQWRNGAGTKLTWCLDDNQVEKSHFQGGEIRCRSWFGTAGRGWRSHNAGELSGK